MSIKDVLKAHGGTMEAAHIAYAASMCIEDVYAILVSAYEAGLVRIRVSWHGDMCVRNWELAA